MARITAGELAFHIDRGAETASVEFKSTCSLGDNEGMVYVARAVLAMSNRRDGGIVVIGVEDQGNKLNPTGVGDEVALGWNYDDVSSKIAGYADPFVEFELQVLELGAKRFVVLNVEEFDQIPVVARKGFPHPYKGQPDIVQKGALYVRSYKKPESVPVPTSAEMRAVIELAINKGMRRRFAEMYAQGIRQLSLAPEGVDVAAEAVTAEKFAAELKGGGT